MVAVHADGGTCHGTPLVAGRCPRCGIAPDMQSVELRPADPLDAGVISSDAPIVLSPDDADRVAALLEERPGPTEAMRALFAERRPVAGWHEDSPGRWLLAIGPAMAEALSHDGYWSADVGEVTVASGAAPTLAAAQLAAEDALRAIAAEILRAVGR
jgi:hypothetical protein